MKNKLFAGPKKTKQVACKHDMRIKIVCKEVGETCNLLMEKTFKTEI